LAAAPNIFSPQRPPGRDRNVVPSTSRSAGSSGQPFNPQPYFSICNDYVTEVILKSTITLNSPNPIHPVASVLSGPQPPAPSPQSSSLLYPEPDARV
jgi:hypothetical protein